MSQEDAAAFGLNMLSDGKNCIVAVQAKNFQKQLADKGCTVHPVDVSEFKKSSGGI